MNNRLRLSLTAPVAVLALWATSLAAQPAMSGFLPIDKLVFFVDGVEDSAAEVYQSQAAGAYLVISRAIESPILVQARSAVVSTVNLMKVDRQADGTVNLLPDATLESLGRFIKILPSVNNHGQVYAMETHHPGAVLDIIHRNL